jgi:hypothetical protein
MPTFFVTYDWGSMPSPLQLPAGYTWQNRPDSNVQATCHLPEQALAAFLQGFEPWEQTVLRTLHTVGVLTAERAWRLVDNTLIHVPEEHPDVAEWRALWADWLEEVAQAATRPA